MIDRVINFGPIQQDSYYFQLIPLSLSIVNTQCQLPAQGTTYKFTVSKGAQKFDQNKIPIQANFQVVNTIPVLVINTCRLNFYLPNYIKQKKHEFSLTMVQRENNQDFQLGEYKINVDQLVTEYKESNKSRHEYKTNFSDDYQLQFQIYVEKNRMALQKNIRENKTERINKSPLRARKEEKSEIAKKSSINSNKKQQDLTPSRDKDDSIIQDPTPINPTQGQPEEKVQNKTEINEERVEEKAEERSPTPPPIVQEKDESFRKQSNQSPQSPPRQQRRSFTKEQGSQIRQKSQKNESLSRKSNDQVPLIVTKQKQLSKINTPSQIRQSRTQKQGLTASVIIESQKVEKPKEDTSTKQKILLSLFLVLSIVVTYFAMHPNRKV